MNIKRYEHIKLIKENLISTWYFCMKPLAYILLKYDDWYYKHRKKTHSKWSDEYVIKKYAKIFIKKLVDLRNKEDYFEVAKWTNYDDNDKTILEAIHNEQKYGLDNWYFDTNQSDTVGRVEQLTDLFVKELKKYPEISCTYFDIRDKNKYCSVPMNYKKTLKVELKEGKI